MGEAIGILSIKGGVGKSLSYSEYISLADGDVVQIGPYTDNLLENNKSKIKNLIVQTNKGQETFEVLEPPEELVLNVVEKNKDSLISKRKKPMCIMRKPAPESLLKIKTSNGNIEVTKEHEFLIIRDGNFEKLRAEELTEKKDYVLTFNYPKIKTDFEDADPDIVRLLGYLIGDGYIEKRNKNHFIHVFSGKSNLTNIKETFKKVFGEFKLIKDKRGNVYRVSFFKTKEIKKIFLEYGVKPELSSKKEIPKNIFRANNKICAEFISALFDCDGHVCKIRNEIQYDTKSLKLALQISNLLRTRFKIDSQLHETYKKPSNSLKEKQKYLRLNISGEDIFKFHCSIGFRDKLKQERLEKHIQSAKYNTNIKLFPFGKIIRIIRKNSGIDAQKIADLMGCSRQMIYEYEWGLYALSKNSIKKFIKTLQNLGVSDYKLEFLETILNKGYGFRRIDRIEEVSYNYPYVYDFQICDEGGYFTHGNGIVVSNTTTTAALGAALAEQGKNILLVDANFSAPNLALHLGIVNPKFSLYDVVQGKANALGSVMQTDYGFDIIAGRPGLKKVFYPDYLKLKEKIKHLQYHYDMILIDSSPTLDHETLAAMLASDKLLIITTPDHVTLSCTLHAIKVAKQKKVPIIGIVLNRTYRKRFELSTKEIEKMAGVPVLAVIPHDINILKALSEFKPTTYQEKDRDAVVEYKKLAAFLMGKNYKDKRFKSRIKDFFSFFSKATEVPKHEVNRQIKIDHD